MESNGRAKKPTRMDPFIARLSIWMFAGGTVLGAAGAWLYYRYLISVGGWDPSGSASFHLILIIYGCAIMLPLIILSVYLLVRGYTMQLYGLELMEQSSSTLGVVEQEVRPLVERIQSIVDRLDDNNSIAGAVKSLEDINTTLKDALTFGGGPRE